LLAQQMACLQTSAAGSAADSAGFCILLSIMPGTVTVTVQTVSSVRITDCILNGPCIYNGKHPTLAASNGNGISSFLKVSEAAACLARNNQRCLGSCIPGMEQLINRA
jgi:hypothetical protein